MQLRQYLCKHSFNSILPWRRWSASNNGLFGEQIPTLHLLNQAGYINQCHCEKCLSVNMLQQQRVGHRQLP